MLPNAGKYHYQRYFQLETAKLVSEALENQMYGLAIFRVIGSVLGLYTEYAS
jgi:hypothetical protein